MLERELRNERRFSSTLLPGKYSALKVKFPTGEDDIVRTTEVSIHGFSILSEKKIELYTIGKQLMLYPIASQRPIYGKVSYVKQLGNLTRAGIELLEFGHYSAFKNELEAVIKKLKDHKTLDP